MNNDLRIQLADKIINEIENGQNPNVISASTMRDIQRLNSLIKQDKKVGGCGCGCKGAKKAINQPERVRSRGYVGGLCALINGIDICSSCPDRDLRYRPSYNFYARRAM